MGGSLGPPRTPPAYRSDTDPSGLGQTAAAMPAIAIIYCQELNALPPGTSLISPVNGVDLSTSSCKKWGCYSTTAVPWFMSQLLDPVFHH